jgi:hypothetical protein
MDEKKKPLGKLNTSKKKKKKKRAFSWGCDKIGGPK